jgi:hypothetical protein
VLHTPIRRRVQNAVCLNGVGHDGDDNSSAASSDASAHNFLTLMVAGPVAFSAGGDGGRRLPELHNWRFEIDRKVRDIFLRSFFFKWVRCIPPTPRIEGRVASESLSLGDCRESCVFIGLLVLVGVRYW